jgi:hypothetical protein
MNLKFKDIEEMHKYFFKDKNNKGIILTNLFMSLQKAILNKDDSAPFASIEFETGGQMDLSCEKGDFNTSLDNCLSFFEEDEQFERCAEILKLKEMIKLY